MNERRLKGEEILIDRWLEELLQGEAPLQKIRPQMLRDVDAFESVKVDNVISELADAFSEDQLGVLNMWKENERVRRKESERRMTIAHKAGEEFLAAMPDIKIQKSDMAGISVERILSYREKLLEAFEVTDGYRLLPSKADKVVHDLVMSIAANSSVGLATIDQTVRAYASQYCKQTLTAADCKNILWFIAGNIEAMVFNPVAPFTAPARAIWLPAVLIDVDTNAERKGVRGTLLTLIGMAGEISSVRVYKFVPHTAGKKFIGSLMFGIAAFSKTVKDMQVAYGDYCGMRTWLYLDPSSVFGNFSRAECAGSFIQYNRSLLKERLTVECPNGKGNVTCGQCSCGLDECFRGTHELSFDQGTCTDCGKESQRVLKSMKVCVNCYRKFVETVARRCS